MHEAMFSSEVAVITRGILTGVGENEEKCKYKIHLNSEDIEVIMRHLINIIFYKCLFDCVTCIYFKNL